MKDGYDKSKMDMKDGHDKNAKQSHCLSAGDVQHTPENSPFPVASLMRRTRVRACDSRRASMSKERSQLSIDCEEMQAALCKWKSKMDSLR